MTHVGRRIHSKLKAQKQAADSQPYCESHNPLLLTCLSNQSLIVLYLSSGHLDDKHNNTPIIIIICDRVHDYC